MASNKRTIAGVVAQAAKAAGLEPFDYILDQLRDGVPFRKLAKILDVSRQSLSTYAHAFPDAAELIAEARTEGTHARIEAAIERLADCDETPAGVAKAKAIMDSEQWLAARFNQRTFGDRATTQVNVQVTAGKSFLDAMRVRRMSDTSRARLIDAPQADENAIESAIDTNAIDADYTVSDDNTTT